MSDLIQYREDVIKVDPGNGEGRSGQYFTCPEARNRFFAFGCAPYGGRHVYRGPVDEEPFAFIFACGAMITSGSEDPMTEFRDLTLHPGDRVYVEHYGWHRLELNRDGYNLNLVRETS